MDTILVIIVVAVAILLLKKVFIQPQVELKSNRDQNTRPERLITTPPRAFVTAVDENGEPVSELDPRELHRLRQHVLGVHRGAGGCDVD